MFNKAIGCAGLFLLTVIPARADFSDDIAAMRAEVAKARGAHDARLSYRYAPGTLETAFDAHGVVWAKRYTVSWGQNGLYLAWGDAKSFHNRAERTLRDWDNAVRSGKYDAALVAPLLTEGMRAFRIVDRDMHGWFDEYISEKAESAKLLDLARAASLAGDHDLARYYRELAKHTHDDATRPSFREIGEIVVIPPVPPEGGGLTSPRIWAVDRANRLAQKAIESRSTADLRRALNEAQRVLRTYPGPQSKELATVLQILDERVSYAERPITDLLDQADKMEPGPLRNALLSEAQDRLMDRMGHLAPIIAAGAETEEDRRAAVSDMLELAKRITMLRDDLDNPISLPSGLLRSINGVKAAADLLDLANSDDPRAKEILDVINDAAGTSPSPVSPTAPFAAPAGAAAAQLGRTRKAWDHASEALQGVREAIGGDPNGLAQARAAAQRLKDALDPRAFVKDMTDGFIDGIVSNLPFARSLIGWFRG